jgi:hypothetical protein
MHAGNGVEAVVLGGSGANRTVTLTPAANQSGTTTITVAVSDGASTVNRQFSLVVNPVIVPPEQIIHLSVEIYSDPF